jgi:hypothetical protein
MVHGTSVAVFIAQLVTVLIAGTETDLSVLRHARRPTVSVSLSRVIVPFMTIRRARSRKSFLTGAGPPLNLTAAAAAR